MRRECLEISDIPGNIDDNALEETVLNLFSKVNAFVDPLIVENCHCPKSTDNTPQNVTVKKERCLSSVKSKA